jgi:hypothetical protein
MYKKLVAWLGQQWLKMLHSPDVNSRVIYLAHSGVSVVGTLILVIAFIVAKDKTGYDTMVLALNGGAVGGAIGRYLSKKGNKADEGEDAPVDSGTPKTD